MKQKETTMKLEDVCLSYQVKWKFKKYSSPRGYGKVIGAWERYSYVGGSSLCVGSDDHPRGPLPQHKWATRGLHLKLQRNKLAKVIVAQFLVVGKQNKLPWGET